MPQSPQEGTGAPDFESFVRDESAALLRLAFQLTAEREASLDLVQEVFLKVHQKWVKVCRAKYRRAYVRRMLVNQYLNDVRRPLLLTRSAHGERHQASVQDHAESIASDGRFEWILRGLPARQRTALVLRYYCDLPDSEIAALLSCRRATVRSLVARGLATLRLEYQDNSGASNIRNEDPR